MDARVKTYDDKMQKAFDFLLSDYQTIRAGRANPHVLDKVKVDYYGTMTPIQQVGNITIPEARMIQIAPWEKSKNMYLPIMFRLKRLKKQFWLLILELLPVMMDL